MDYGIKVSRPGFSAQTAAINELAFSSKFKTLKVYDHGSGSLTSSSRTATIPHNLGYVPVFMVHTTMSTGFGGSLFDSSDYVLAPAGLSGVLSDPMVGTNDDLFAYADTTNLYIKAQENFGSVVCKVYNDIDISFGWENTTTGYNSGEWAVGNESAWGVEKGAVRFINVAVAKNTTVYSATLNLYINNRIGTGQVKSIIYGIDEDNTGAMNSGTAGTARAKTTASTGSNTTLSAGNGWSISVTGQVNEILARTGWVSGNAMGFIIDDNSTTVGNAYNDNSTSVSRTHLNIIPSNTIASYKYTIFLNQLE